jgi:hypothetical protein
LQSIVVAAKAVGSAAIAIDHCEAVHLGRSQIAGPVRLEVGTLTVSQCAITVLAGREREPSLFVSHAVALLSNTRVIGALAPAIVVRRGALDASAEDPVSIVATGSKTIVELSDGSKARLSGIELAAAAIACDATSSSERFASALPAVRFVGAPSRSAPIEIEIVGPPSARGVLVVSPGMLLRKATESRQWVLSDLLPGKLGLPLTIPGGGRLRFSVPVDGFAFVVGSPLFMQFVLDPSGSGAARPRASLIDGATIVP